MPSSPAGVQLTLETPKEGELTRNSSAVVPLTLDAEAMSAWRDHQVKQCSFEKHCAESCISNVRTPLCKVTNIGLQ